MTRRDWLVLAAIVVLASPPLVLRYLPMTDLPQHLAIASIISNLDDPAFGFSEWYTVDFSNTLYVLPYAFSVGLGSILPLRTAMALLVFCSVAAFPLGVFATARSLGKSPLLALLAFPLVYNRPFFWGFINFNLAVGLVFVAVSLLVLEERRPWQTWALAGLTIAIGLTHVHGLALLMVIAVLLMLLSPTRETMKRTFPVAPGLVGLGLWASYAGHARGYGVPESPDLSTRIQELPDQVLGGYQDTSELLVLTGFASIAIVLLIRRFTGAVRERWTDAELVFWMLLVLNAVLYLVLPAHTMTAKFIHFRHAFLAAACVPLLCSIGTRPPRWVTAVLALLGLGALGNSWVHLRAFDREAAHFDFIVMHFPDEPRVASLVFDQHGEVMKTFPYVHFVGYVQAERGGFVSSSFAKFWNVPVRFRKDARRPPEIIDSEWHPDEFNDRFYKGFYDYLLVRQEGVKMRPYGPALPYQPVFSNKPWYIYRRDSAPAFAPPGAPH